MGALSDEAPCAVRVVVANADIKNQVDYNNNDGTLLRHPGFDLSDRTRLSVYALHRTRHPAHQRPASVQDGSCSTSAAATWGRTRTSSTPAPRMWGLALQHAFANGRVSQGLRPATWITTCGWSRSFTNGPWTGGQHQADVQQPGNQQKNMAFDASYSQMFRLAGHKSEFVLGSDYKRWSDIQTYATATSSKINVFDFDPTGSPTDLQLHQERP